MERAVEDALTHVEIVVDSHHRCIAACALAFDLNHGEFAVLGGVPNVNAAEVLRDGIQDVGRPAKHARCCRAHLHKVLAYRLTEQTASIVRDPVLSIGGGEEVREDRGSAPVEHGVESSDFVHTHRWEFKQLGDIVHDAYTCPSLVLPLTKIQKGNNSSLLVLRRIVGNNLLCSLQVVGREREWDLTKTALDTAWSIASRYGLTLGLLYVVSRCYRVFGQDGNQT